MFVGQVEKGPAAPWARPVLNGGAAVSIKGHRSKETPPTEIPTEEGEEEGVGG